MEMAKMIFHGVMPPMITPFKANGQVDYNAFIANIKAWNQTGLSGYLVNGSNSETAYLSEREKLRLVALAAENAAPQLTLTAGTGMEEPRATIALTNKCAQAGAASALVLTPSYYGAAMTSAALIDFFTRVAEGSKIPILIYNVPKFTHVNIKADAVAVLSAHENIIGMKDSAGDVPQLAAFQRASLGQCFSLLVGTAAAWYPALALGIKAGIHAAANYAPKACVEVQKAYEAGDLGRAQGIYRALLPLNTAVTAAYGIPGLKHACDLAGYQGGQVRCPLQPLDEAARGQVAKIFATAREELAQYNCQP